MLFARLVKINDTVEIPVISDADGTLPIGLGREHHLFDSCGTVEHRILGVIMQVHKTLSHSLMRSFRHDNFKLHAWHSEITSIQATPPEPHL